MNGRILISVHIHMYIHTIVPHCVSVPSGRVAPGCAGGGVGSGGPWLCVCVCGGGGGGGHSTGWWAVWCGLTPMNTLGTQLYTHSNCCSPPVDCACVS